MFEQDQENSKILISIATELESCCESIKNKIDALSNQVTTGFRRLRDLLISNFSNLETELTNQFEDSKVYIKSIEDLLTSY